MRAPPEAVKQTNGSFCSSATLHAAHEALADHRAHRAAHELELEGGRDDRHVLDRALHHHQRVGLPGLLLGLREALGVLARVLELQGVDRQHLGRRSRSGRRGRAGVEARHARRGACGGRTSGRRSGSSRGRCVEHRVARRRTWSRGPRARFLRRRLRWIFGGSSFWSQLMGPSASAIRHIPAASCSPKRAAGLPVRISRAAPVSDVQRARISRGTSRSAAAAGACSISWMMRLPMTTASATCADAPRRRAVADAEADADRERGLARGCAPSFAPTSARSMCDAPVTPRQRHVIDVAAARGARPARCAPRSRSAPAGRSDRSRPVSRAPRTPRTPPADSRRRARRRRRRRARAATNLSTPIASIGFA